jgi:riboflavin synthase
LFTGLIERTGQVIALMPAHQHAKEISQLIVDPGAAKYKVKLGDSVAINGCCLTVVSNDLNMLKFDISSETLTKTSLGLLHPDDAVNLERAMALGDRLGGHMVAGHVDTTGKILKIERNKDGWFIQINIPKSYSKYIISKGSICIDGISLTVNSLTDTEVGCLIDLMIIPKTIETTTISAMGVGQPVNIEVDLIGKYMERLQTPGL